MVDRDTLKRVLEVALRRGGEFADIYIERQRTIGLAIENMKAETPSSGVSIGAGVRVIAGGIVYYASTEDVTPDGLMKAAQFVAQMVQNGFAGREFLIERIQQAEPPFQWPDRRVLDASATEDAMSEIVKVASDAAWSYSPKVKQVRSSLSHWVKDVWILNSLGMYAEERRVYTRLAVSVTAQGGDGVPQRGFAAPGKALGIEVFEEMIDPAEVGKKAAKQAVVATEARPAPSAHLPVILAPGFGGVIFHEATGHGLEADGIRRGTSVFTGKLGKRVGTDKVTLIDSATLPGEWGSFQFSDEGFPAQHTVLIEDGILRAYMVDYREHLMTGLPHTASGRRQSYLFPPLPRMRNTFIKPGSDRFEDMLADIKKGVLAVNFGGGQVDPSTGNFVFGVREAYLIENGKITYPLRGVTLAGNGLEILSHIVGVSGEDDFAIDPGMCGKGGQSVPAGVGEPYVYVDSILVGGTGDEG